MDVTLRVPRRFRGPTLSGNGGWTSGSLAAFLPGAPAVRVRLSSPPPLETPMAVTVQLDASHGRRTASAGIGDRMVVEAVEVEAVGETEPAAVDAAVARAAVALFGGAADHPFPECFTCGTARAAGDGLRLFPGSPDGEPGRAACAWTPDPSLDAGDGQVPAAVVWAALDCPSGWAIDLRGRPMVLGTITAQVLRRPRIGEPCVVVGASPGVSGRKATATSAVYGEDGALLARAASVWIAVDPAAVRPAD